MASTDVSSNTSTQTPHSGCSDARERGSAPDQASEAAGRYMAEVLHVAAL